MNRMAFGLLLSLSCLAPADAMAGFAFQANLQSPAHDRVGSLNHNGLGDGSPMVGTNLGVPGLKGGGGFLDFTTGASDGTDAKGDALYKAGGNFFVLDGTLATAAGTTPMLYDASAGAAVVKSLGGGVYQLTMAITDGSLGVGIAGPAGSIAGSGYDGTLDFQYVVNPSLAGAQLLSGTITFATRPALQVPDAASSPFDAAVPEPASALMVGLGLAGVASLRAMRKKSAA